MKSLLIGLLLCLSFSQSVLAQNNERDFGNVIGPFPPIGSAEEKADIEQLLYYQNTRTPEDCKKAQAESHASLETFFGGEHKLLSERELRFIEKKLKWLKVKTGLKIYYYKKKYDRIRPYIVHPEIKPCIELEDSLSYPSGHTTLARVYGRVLSVIYPERALLFMKRADEAALNRMIGGVHHPSDVAAGKKLGDDIADDYLEDGDRFYQLKSLGL